MKFSCVHAEGQGVLVASIPLQGYHHPKALLLQGHNEEGSAMVAH